MLVVRLRVLVAVIVTGFGALVSFVDFNVLVLGLVGCLDELVPIMDVRFGALVPARVVAFEKLVPALVVHLLVLVSASVLIFNAVVPV